MRSCTCNRRAYTLTRRANLLTTDNLAVRNVSDGYMAEKRQYVMLAKRIKLYILDYHHARPFVGENGLFDDLLP